MPAIPQPHSVCLAGNRPLIWSFVASDTVIAVAYILIAASLLYIVGRHNVPYRGFFRSFAAFIFACALSHVAHIYTMFYATGFWDAAYINIATAAVSITVCICVLLKVPEIITFLRERGQDVNVRAERYQDADQFLALSSHLQDSTLRRAKGMTDVLDGRAHI